MIEQLLDQIVSSLLFARAQHDRCGILVSLSVLLLDNLIRYLSANLRHEPGLAVVEVVVEQAQVLLVLLLH